MIFLFKVNQSYDIAWPKDTGSFKTQKKKDDTVKIQTSTQWENFSTTIFGSDLNVYHFSPSF